jgi:hypothetical protein
MSEQESAGTAPEDVYTEDGSATAVAEGAATAVAPVEESKPLFTDEEIKQFDADDTEAGSAIGKMLVLFFLYTVCAMSHVAWWTFYGEVNWLFVTFTVIAMNAAALLAVRRASD